MAKKTATTAPPSHEFVLLTPREAIRLLERQYEQGQKLLAARPIDKAKLDAWENTTREFLIKAFGPDSSNVSSVTKIGKYGAFPMNAGPEWWERHRAKSLDEQLTMLRSTIEQLEIQLELEEKITPNRSEQDTVAAIERICYRFHLVARQMRSRYNSRPTLDVSDEYDVQNLLHSLLCLFFDDIRPEEWTPSYAGKSARMDFLLKVEQIVVEAKKTRDGLSAKEVGTQLIDDIARYKTHPDCKTLICFVYDPEGRIANPKGIENDLSREEGGMIVKVIIAPRGY